MADPKVSVVMPVYNGEKYLVKALQSVCDQTYKDFEFIIIDDGSRDQSRDIIEQYRKEDPRIRVLVNEENMGVARTLNRGLRSAQGEYIARHDADDVALPQRFEMQVGVLDGDRDVVLLGSHYDIINEKDEVTAQRRPADSPLIPLFLLFDNYLGGHSQMMFRRSHVMSLGGYPETRLHIEDYALWIALSRQGKIRIIENSLQLRRVHSESIISRHKEEIFMQRDRLSQESISELLGSDVSQNDIRLLRKFFHAQRIPSKAINSLNSLLERISNAYLTQYCQEAPPSFAQEVRTFLRVGHVANI